MAQAEESFEQVLLLLNYILMWI